MDSVRVLFRGEKQRKQPGQGDARVADTNERFGGRDKRCINEDGRRLALLGGGEISRILGKREFTSAGMAGRGEAGDLDGAFADEFTLQFLSDFLNGEGHNAIGFEEGLDVGKAYHFLTVGVPNF